MDLRPEDLEQADLAAVEEGGLDPAAVMDLLRRAAERIRTLEQDGVRAVGGTVADMLDQAVKSADELREEAEAAAAHLRAEAEVEGARMKEEAAALAAKQIGDAERAVAEMIESATAEADALRETAERDAVERATAVINQAQRRLDRLLAAERDVHDRLQAAMTDIQTSVARVGVQQAEELALTIEDPDLSAVDEATWADDDRSDEDRTVAVSSSRRSA